MLICSTGCFFLIHIKKKIKRFYCLSDNMLKAKSTPTLYTYFLGKKKSPNQKQHSPRKGWQMFKLSFRIYWSIFISDLLTVSCLENSLQCFLPETGLVVAPYKCGWKSSHSSESNQWAQEWWLMQICSLDMSGCVDQWDGAGAAATALSQRCAWSWGSGIHALTGWW